jgi:very-short-patch-repair endonuclease
MPKLATENSRIHQMARSLRRNQTIAERQLWASLRNRQMAGFKFRRQFPIGEFVTDFCCKESQLVIELDGVQHADDPVQVAVDRKRTALLNECGYRLIRFWNEEILSNLDGVLEQILIELNDPLRSAALGYRIRG